VDQAAALQQVLRRALFLSVTPMMAVGLSVFLQVNAD
jgi:hypothetical protein